MIVNHEVAEFDWKKRGQMKRSVPRFGFRLREPLAVRGGSSDRLLDYGADIVRGQQEHPGGCCLR